MIDVGLLLSVVVALGAPAAISAQWAFAGEQRPGAFIDVVLGPLLLGLAVARVVAVLLDDPHSIGRVTDLLIIRSGVEFWPGAVATAGLLALTARRSGTAPGAQLAAIAPLALIGVAGYEATCVVRSGCFGPASPVGLRPSGVSTVMLPVGIAMGLALGVAAFALHRWSRRETPWTTVLVATLWLAVVRSIGSFWLPHLGDGITRPHLSSIVVAAATGLGSVVAWHRPPRGVDDRST